MNKIFCCPVLPLFIIGILFFSCEQDDICLENTPATPKLIVRFFSIENTVAPAPVNNLLVRALGSNNDLPTASPDSILLPLDSRFSSNKFILISDFNSDNESSDTLEIRFDRYDTYINRACGYKANFVFKQPPVIINEAATWVKGFATLKDTISDETATHLALYH